MRIIVDSTYIRNWSPLIIPVYGKVFENLITIYDDSEKIIYRESIIITHELPQYTCSDLLIDEINSYLKYSCGCDNDKDKKLKEMLQFIIEHKKELNFGNKKQILQEYKKERDELNYKIKILEKMITADECYLEEK